jgi:Cu/Ag efflux protein CusF
MLIVSTLVLAGSVFTAGSTSPGLQVKTIPDQTITATATIEAIEANSRLVTLLTEDGTHEVVRAPAEMKRFSELKVGDKITARYYGSLIVRMKKPGEPVIDVDKSAVTPGTGANPGGTVATQRTLTVTITAIDPNVPSITVKSANGWTYSRRVDDKKALEKVKVGDQLDITWNDAVLISVTPAK